MRQRLLRAVMAAVLGASAIGITAPAVIASSGSPGDETIVITINDSFAGGSYDQVFELAYENETASGTPIYIYVPEGAIGDPTVESVDPQFDHNPDDEFDPCADTADEDHLVTQAQIDALGDSSPTRSSRSTRRTSARSAWPTPAIRRATRSSSWPTTSRISRTTTAPRRRTRPATSRPSTSRKRA